MHLFKVCRSSVGPSDAISGSITVGPEAMPHARVSMRLNSLHSHLTSYWSPVAVCWARSNEQHAPSPLYSFRSLMPSAVDLLKVSLNRAATRPVLQILNSISAQNGWNCLNKSHRA